MFSISLQENLAPSLGKQLGRKTLLLEFSFLYARECSGKHQCPSGVPVMNLWSGLKAFQRFSSATPDLLSIVFLWLLVHISIQVSSSGPSAEPSVLSPMSVVHISVY